MSLPTVDDALVTTAQLSQLRETGVLEAADVHVADAVARLTGAEAPDVLLAVALAVRAPRLGHVCLDLRRLHEVGVATEEGDRAELELPELAGWRATLSASPAVRAPSEVERVAPLVLDGDRLYLDRYWRYEQRLVARLRDLVVAELDDREPLALTMALDRLFPTADDEVQRRAAEVAATRALTVLTGGPGTGKTTTLVRILATLGLTAPAGAPPRAVLAAPTGKAAARMAEAVRGATAALDVPSEVGAALEQLPALTVHRLLGYRPDRPTRFRHDRDHPLPFDVVVLDEASMASLPLMAKLVDALPAGARLLLVGDRDQLASVDAGAVLHDICGPDHDLDPPVDPRAEAPVDPRAEASVDPLAEASDAPSVEVPAVADAIVRLTRFHRFGVDSGIGAVARTIRRLDAPEEGRHPGDVLALLRGERTETEVGVGYEDIALRTPGPAADGPLPTALLDQIVDAYAAPVRAAVAGEDPSVVLAGFERLRVLSALRRGPEGVGALDRAIAAGLARVVDGFSTEGRFPIGQLLMVTRNDQRLELYNGDVGVVIRDPADPARRRVAFPAAGGTVRVLSPARLPEVESVFAMSIHKSQGSQFEEVVVVLPRRDVPLLTRELIYTAITRAQQRATVVADESVLTEALRRRVQRASGLTERLWRATPERP